MSLRTADFSTLAARLRTAAATFEHWAGIVDQATDQAPPHPPAVPVAGVRRPVEDLVVARDETGLYAELDATRRHAAQAVLNAEAAINHAAAIAHTFDH